MDKHYYERLISTQKETLNELNLEISKQLAVNPQDFILKDPLVLDFYNLKEKQTYSENQIEQAIIDNIQKFYWSLEKDFLLWLGNNASTQSFRITTLTWYFTITS